MRQQTASQLTAISNATTESIDASGVTGLTLIVIKTLLTEVMIPQFTEDSFGSLGTVSDVILSGSDLAEAIDQANAATGDTTTVFSITAAGEITGTEEDFTALIDDENAQQIDITNENLTIDIGTTISVATARPCQDNSWNCYRNDRIRHNSCSDVDENTGLTGTDAYTITIAAEDEKVTAKDLTDLYSKTSVAVDANAVTQITGTVAEANIVYGAGDSEITGLGNETVVTTESSLTDVTALNTLDGNTT